MQDASGEASSQPKVLLQHDSELAPCREDIPAFLPMLFFFPSRRLARSLVPLSLPGRFKSALRSEEHFSAALLPSRVSLEATLRASSNLAGRASW